ncbi:MAG TPA: DUF3667 domain-containing protein [Thermoanaerobaculia bacterium]|jgi:hypothetical protein
MEAVAADARTPAEKRCTNCGADVVDVYCARCGERQPDHHDYAVSHFAHHTFHELVHLDSKLFTTLRLLLFKPGFLTAEYFAGRKTRYVAPLRLFLTLFAVHLLAYTVYKPVAVYTMEGLARMGDAKPVEHLVNKVAAKKKITPEVARERINEKMAKSMSLLQLFNILLLAAVLKVLFFRRYYVEHLVYSAHYLSFAYLFGLMWWPLYLVFGFKPVQVWGSVVSMAVAVAYLYVATRRFYGDSKVKSAVKAALTLAGVQLVTMFMLLVTLLAAIFAIIKA